MNKRVLFLISFLAVSNLMCLFSARDYDQEHSFTKTEPQKEQLVGEYFPTLGTITLIRDKGHYSVEGTSIIVYADETFDIVNMPDWWVPNNAGYGVSNGGFDSGKGNWSISSSSGLWQIRFGFETGTFNSINEPFGITLDLGGEQPPYTIWIYIGDPDTGRVMVFEQSIENP